MDQKIESGLLMNAGCTRAALMLGGGPDAVDLGSSDAWWSHSCRLKFCIFLQAVQEQL